MEVELETFNVKTKRGNSIKFLLGVLSPLFKIPFKKVITSQSTQNYKVLSCANMLLVNCTKSQVMMVKSLLRNMQEIIQGQCILLREHYQKCM